jgi:hypothetical protein
LQKKSNKQNDLYNINPRNIRNIALAAITGALLIFFTVELVGVGASLVVGTLEVLGSVEATG